MPFLVRCPACKNTMLVQPRLQPGEELAPKRKVCVYCGKSFSVRKQALKYLIR
ncbi:MAG: hypothetical protein V1725_03000 [archaeon]